jgi:hypothetical protein
MPKVDLDNLETAHDIAARTLYSLNTVRSFAQTKKFPKCAHRIGNVKFYKKADVNRYFAQKIDRRFNDFKRSNYL